MLEVAFAPGAYNRSAMGIAQARLVNYYAEATPFAPDARFPRPCLTSPSSVGSGPIRGLFIQPGVFGGELFVVSATTLYRAGASVGTIAGTDMVRFAASATQLVIVANGSAYAYDGSTLTLIDDTDLPAVTDVVFIGGRFVFGLQNSSRFRWSDTSSATTVDGLAFSNAESSPDYIVGLAIALGQLVIFGSTSVEFWDLTGNDDEPFQHAGSGTYLRGCVSRDAIVVADNSVFWIGDDRIIYRGKSVPERVSNHGIEAALKSCTSLSSATAFEARVEGHAFLVVNVPGVTTFALDRAAPQASDGWAEWSSYGRTTFRGRCSVMSSGDVLVGDEVAGNVYTLASGVYSDNGDPVTFLASAFIKGANKAERCNNIVVQGARGVGLATGQGSDPITELRFSDDQGRSWSDWFQASPGAVGQYKDRAVWQRMGLVREPGRVLEIRTTDPVLATLTGLLVNQERPYG